MSEATSDSAITSEGEERETGDAASGSGSGEHAEGKRKLFGGMTPAEAGRKGGRARAERLAQAAGTAGRKRDLRREIRQQLEDEADDVLEAVRQAIKQGRDVRALTSLLDRVYGQDEVQTAPATVQEIDAMDTQQLVVYIAQLEAERASQQLASEAQGMEDSGV